MAYADVIAADSPTAWARLEGTLGNSGSIGGNFIGTAGTYIAGARGQGMRFAATGVQRTGDSSGSYGTVTLMSLETWFRTTSTVQSFIAGVGLSATGSNGLSFRLETTGKVSLIGYGTTLASPVALNNNQWHHLVGTTNGNTITYYVDGVQVATSSGQGASGTVPGNVYVGRGSTGNNFTGDVDEMASYKAVLTAAQVANHYNAPAVDAAVSVTVDLDAATATATAPEAEVIIPASIAVDLEKATATAQAYDASFEKVARLTPTADQYFQYGTLPYAETVNGINLNATDGDAAALDFSTPSDVNATGYQNATLTLKSTSKTGAAVVYAITSPRGTDAVPASLSANSVGITWAADTSKVVDVSSLVDPAGFYGLWIVATSGAPGFYTRENTTAANRPNLAISYAVVAQSTAVDLTTVQATASANDVTVETTSNVTIDVETATAVLSASDVEVDASTNPNVEINLEALSVALRAYDAEVVQNTAVDLSAGSATATANDVTVVTRGNALVDLDTPRILATVYQLTDVNGEPILPTEDEDKFFVSTMRLLDTAAVVTPRGSGSSWFRFNDVSGTKAVDRTGRWEGTYSNVVLGQSDGPNGRRYAGFTGNALFVQNDNSNNTDELYANVGTLEFAFRTTKASQFIMRLDDVAFGLINSTDTPSRDLYLKDGKLVYRAWTRNGFSAPAVPVDAFTGFTDLADGDWHHVILASDQSGDRNNGRTKVNVYVDGKLEIRRDSYGFSFPDYIGGRPGFQGSAEYQPVPQSDWFVGDMSEVVFYNGMLLSEDDVHVQNDNLYGYDPVYVETARVFADAHNPVVKGNTKRVLTLNFGLQTSMLNAGPEKFGFSGLAYPGSAMTNGVQVGNYQVFQYSVLLKTSGSSYLDVVTDEPRLIDLDVDLSLDDFDVINIINYPLSGSDFDLYDQYNGSVPFGGKSGRQQLEQVVEQVKQFAVDGGSLFVTDPGSAVALGIIDDIEYVPSLREPKDANFDYGTSPATYDYRSATINPWGDNPGAPITTVWQPRASQTLNPNVDYKRAAHFYDDEHSNNRQRVRELVEGLTDQPGRILADAIAYWGYRGDGEMAAEKWLERPTGLTVGDEFWVMGTPQAGRGSGWNNTAHGGGPVSPFMRPRGFVAAPLDNVKAGVAVTTFASTHWVGEEQVQNPYRDYAVSVVVRPGDTLGGKVISGRVYMNFTESFAELAPDMMHAPVQVIPDNKDIANPIYRETEESREWTYSMWRGSWGGNEGQQETQQLVIQNPDGTITIKDASTDNVVGIRYTSRWPVRYDDAPTMHHRGLKWLTAEVINDGSTTVGASAGKATATAYDVTVETRRSTEVNLTTARATVESYTDADTVASDVTVLLSTAGATAQAYAFTEVVDLDTARVTARAYDDLDGILANADLVVLRLPSTTAILTLEET